ncbi:hypothetical protein D3C76_1422400 [compost metagenome]|jgi:hypothetical protein|uniref:Uncharacterized protein n=1 Tax=Pseudomonas fluorescens TaxID=294 RepID=A0A5E6X6A1_PSEFL|nr:MULTISPECIES: hypothetical protein [Pseudomonas]MBV7526894.1 hypothetical protein [Pseudomonas sp. PDM29]QHF39995.1 hypothetical protein PspS34_17720 [Pseudomonas sp. S34]VVN36265.1 hypothetical protein PS647_05160 [Pseudomonas fluorescens]VVN42356.1 hypothetical protein PS673_05466 [Pseudomonas fluorescens]VVP56610.1 hypothetical protein PS893_05752 [Pseudomonas fluorescens]
MLQNDRDNLELDKLQVEIRRFMAEEMRSPTSTRATLLPFGIGAALALIIFAAAAIVVRLL